MNFDYQGIKGFDISRHQDNPLTPKKTDFSKMVDYGASFVIMKAGQLNWEDRDFSYNWNGVKSVGLSRSSYWFCDKADSGKKQAQKYFDILLDNGYNGEICFADYESGAWSNQDELYNFIVELQRISGLPNEKVGIYTAYYWWLEHVKTVFQREWYAQYPLWLANYIPDPFSNDYSAIKTPSAWKDSEVLILQKGTPSIGLEVGVESKEIDYNEFNGGVEKYKQYFDTSPIIIPEPEKITFPYEISAYGKKYRKAV